MKTCRDCIHFRPLYGNTEVFCPKTNQFIFADWDACRQFAFADWDVCRQFEEGVRWSPPLPAGNSAVDTSDPTSPVPVPADDPEVLAAISFDEWQDAHPCGGCPTYEKYNGNPFGEKCATCVRAGQVTDHWGKE